MLRWTTGIAMIALALSTTARAQVPARPDAYVWRGFDLEWGRWTHRLGELESTIAPVGGGKVGLEVRQRVGAGRFKDPGGAVLTTHYTHFQPGDDDGGLRFWHLSGDALTLSGAYHCTERAGHETGVFRGAMVLGDGGEPAEGIDPAGPTPDQFDHLAVLLNGIEIVPIVPNGAHTVELIRMAVEGTPSFDPVRNELTIPLTVEYRPGCIPGVLHTCSNPVEGPRGATEWTAVIRPAFLLIAWDDDRAEPATARGAMAFERETLLCGDDLDIRLQQHTPIAPPRRPSERAEPVVGFVDWEVRAGAPGRWYSSGRPVSSCEHCAVALTGRHLREFGFSFDRARADDGSFGAEVVGRWSSHPHDGNPFAMNSTNPHWPTWAWSLRGIYADGSFRDEAVSAHGRPALVVAGVSPLD